MDKFTIATKDGELPREYVVRGLYQSPSYDPNNGKVCSRVAKLAHKDVSDYLESVKVKQNKKTGRLEADDENRNRPRDEMWCEALVSATGPLEKIASEIAKSNHLGALVHLPSLVDGFVNIRHTQARILGEEGIEQLVVDKCEKSGREKNRLGQNPPAWLLELCQDYVITNYTKLFENGFHKVAFNKLDLSSPISDDAKKCLSVITDSLQINLQQKQTDATVRILEKHIAIWANKVASEESDVKKPALKATKRIRIETTQL